MTENYRLSQYLQEILTPAEFVELAEKYGGLSLYIAQSAEKMSHNIAAPAKDKLVKAFGGIYITVPMARQYRARFYKAQGYNKRYIAIKLGMTESSVRRLFSRGDSKAKAAQTSPQLDMIEYLIAQRRS